MKIVATSREGLGVADEQLWLVPSLDVGAGIDSAAVNLFVERARSVASRFSLANADEASAVVEICRRLDGIPLAIELAASRMAVDDGHRGTGSARSAVPAAGRVPARAGAPPNTAPRGGSGPTTCLDDAEKTLLATVFGVRRRVRPRKAACAVGGSRRRLRHHWMCWTPWCASRCWSPTGLRGGPGFRCWRRSASSPRSNSSPPARPSEVRTAHAGYFAGREPDILALWDGPRQRDAYAWFAAELANLRTAFRWAADHGDLDVGATIATYAGHLGSLSKTMSLSPGPKSLSSPPAPPIIGGSRSCTRWRRCAGW